MSAKYFLVFSLFSIGHLSVSQESKPETILSAPDTWGPEIFSFPFEFAPSIDYQGFEDIRFAPGWSDTTANDYFTYTFFWYLDTDPQLTADILETHLKAYFGGLMAGTSGRDDLPAVTASFTQKSNGVYAGSVNTYDAFFKKTALTLNIMATSSQCKKTGKYIVRLNLSPKGFQDPLWKMFEEVTLKINCDK